MITITPQIYEKRRSRLFIRLIGGKLHLIMCFYNTLHTIL
jgi:hypothetical protein